MRLKKTINKLVSANNQQAEFNKLIKIPNSNLLNEWITHNQGFIADTISDYTFLLTAIIDSENESIEKQYNALKALILFVDETEEVCKMLGEMPSLWFNNILIESNDLKSLREELLILEKAYMALGMPDEYKTSITIENGVERGKSSKKDDLSLVNAELDQMVYEVAKAPELYNDNSQITGTENLAKLMKRATPSQRGLYPHELSILSSCAKSKYKTSNNTFARYWDYNYGIKDPQYILDMLYERGFIEPDDVYATINQLKVPELKQELSALQLKTSGKKADLVERFINATGEAFLIEKYPERYFRLTDLGKLELDENDYLRYAIYGLDVWDLNRLLTKGKHTCQEIIYNYLIKQCNYYARRYEMGMYRNSKCELYRFLFDEKRYLEAVDTLAEVLYYDLSLSSNFDKEYYTKDVLPWWRLPSLTYAKYGSGMITELAKIQKIMDFTDEKLKSQLKSSFAKITIPDILLLFTVDECSEIVLANLHNDITYRNTIYEAAVQRKNKEYEEIKRKQGSL